MNNKNPDDLRTTVWMKPTPANLLWLKNEIQTSKIPGHSPRKIIIEEKTGRLALVRVG